MSIISPEIEYVDRSEESIRYLEHGWPTDLCRWHAHAEYELHLILETKGRAFVGDYIGDFQPGDLFLTGPHLPHNWVTDSYNHPVVETRDMLVQFSDESMQGLIRAFPEFRGLTGMLELSRAGLKFKNFPKNRAIQHFKNIRASSQIRRVLAFLDFMEELEASSRLEVLSVGKAGTVSGGKRQSQIGEAVDFIVSHFEEELSVSRVADIVGLSETSFTRHFKNITGHRFTEFVNRVRVGEACRMLVETEDQVSNICFNVGFQNLANFNRQFMKLKGVTPTQFREQTRSGLSANRAVPLQSKSIESLNY